MNVTYQTMNERLVEVVPELEATYLDWVETFTGDPVGPHIAYGLVVGYLCACLNDAHNQRDLAPIFAFIEQLAPHEDEQVVNVIHVTVVEGLLGGLSGAALERAIALMGPTTRDIARQAAEVYVAAADIRATLDRA
jgi:hypothetical protein